MIYVAEVMVVSLVGSSLFTGRYGNDDGFLGLLCFTKLEVICGV